MLKPRQPIRVQCGWLCGFRDWYTDVHSGQITEMTMNNTLEYYPAVSRSKDLTPHGGTSTSCSLRETQL